MGNDHSKTRKCKKGEGSAINIEECIIETDQKKCRIHKSKNSMTRKIIIKHGHERRKDTARKDRKMTKMDKQEKQNQ